MSTFTRRGATVLSLAAVTALAVAGVVPQAGATTKGTKSGFSTKDCTIDFRSAAVFNRDLKNSDTVTYKGQKYTDLMTSLDGTDLITRDGVNGWTNGGYLTEVSKALDPAASGWMELQHFIAGGDNADGTTTASWRMPVGVDHAVHNGTLTLELPAGTTKITYKQDSKGSDTDLPMLFRQWFQGDTQKYNWARPPHDPTISGNTVTFSGINLGRGQGLALQVDGDLPTSATKDPDGLKSVGEAHFTGTLESGQPDCPVECGCGAHGSIDGILPTGSLGSNDGDTGSVTGSAPGSSTGSAPLALGSLALPLLGSAAVPALGSLGSLGSTGSNTGSLPGSSGGSVPGSSTGSLPGSSTGSAPASSGSDAGSAPGSSTGSGSIPGSSVGSLPGSSGSAPGSLPTGSGTGSLPLALGSLGIPLLGSLALPALGSSVLPGSSTGSAPASSGSGSVPGSSVPTGSGTGSLPTGSLPGNGTGANTGSNTGSLPAGSLPSGSGSTPGTGSGTGSVPMGSLIGSVPLDPGSVAAPLGSVAAPLGSLGSLGSSASGAATIGSAALGSLGVAGLAWAVNTGAITLPPLPTTLAGMLPAGSSIPGMTTTTTTPPPAPGPQVNNGRG